MTILPSALTSLSTAELAVIARAQVIIDAELRLKSDSPFPIKIRRGIIEFCFLQNQSVIDSLINSYVVAGWDVVRYHSADQGDWFSFAPTYVAPNNSQ